MRKKRKNPHAVALGRKGAEKGARKAGIARWANVPVEERRELGRKAALARWGRKPNDFGPDPEAARQRSALGGGADRP